MLDDCMVESSKLSSKAVPEAGALEAVLKDFQAVLLRMWL